MPLSPSFTGTVIHGDGHGRGLGFPTANLRLQNDAPVPSEGIYAVWVTIEPDTKRLPGVMHLGPRPTFPGSTSTVEVHILQAEDFTLYGQQLTVTEVERIRDIEQFASVAELTEAIRTDCRKALAILSAVAHSIE